MAHKLRVRQAGSLAYAVRPLAVALPTASLIASSIKVNCRDMLLEQQQPAIVCRPRMPFSKTLRMSCHPTNASRLALTGNGQKIAKSLTSLITVCSHVCPTASWTAGPLLLSHSYNCLQLLLLTSDCL